MICFEHPGHADILAETIGVPFFHGRDRCISRVVKGELAGGVLYTEYTGASMCVHVAGFHKHWISKDMLWVAFDYPFNQIGVGLLLGKVEAANKTALEFNRKLGFNAVATIPGVYPSGDLVIMSMRRCDCRQLHLQPRLLAHGKKEQRAAAA